MSFNNVNTDKNFVQRSTFGKYIILISSIFLAVIFLIQFLYKSGSIAFGFENWRPILYMYLIWSTTLCYGVLPHILEARTFPYGHQRIRQGFSLIVTVISISMNGLEQAMTGHLSSHTLNLKQILTIIQTLQLNLEFREYFNITVLLKMSCQKSLLVSILPRKEPIILRLPGRNLPTRLAGRNSFSSTEPL